MKALSCELCGSNELIKKDGMFECAHCGTKYSTEEARKLLISIDNTQQKINYLSAAQKERQIENWQGALAHYDRLLAEDPNHWEALFFSSYCRNRTCTLPQLSSAATQMRKSLKLTLTQIKTTLPNTDHSNAVQIVASYIEQLGRIMFDSAITAFNNAPTVPFFHGAPAQNRDLLKGQLRSILSMLYDCSATIYSLFFNTAAAQHMLLPAHAFFDLLSRQHSVTYDSKDLQPLLNAMQSCGSDYPAVWRKRRHNLLAKIIIWFVLGILCIASLFFILVAPFPLYYGIKNLIRFIKEK